MDKLDSDKLIMCDTDSVVYEPHNRKLKAGNGMGKLKNEILEEYGTNARLIEMVCLAPKHYAMRIKIHHDQEEEEEREHLKIKGYSQRVEFKDVLNFSATKKMLKNGSEKSIQFSQLKRDKTKLSIYEIVSEKKIRAVFDKRIVDLTTMKTVPIGYYSKD